MASANIRSKSARAHGRGFVRWHVSLIATSTSAGMSPLVTARCVLRPDSLAGMPSAFHLLILARVYEVRPALMNRIVVGTTIPAVAAVVLVVGIAR